MNSAWFADLDGLDGALDPQFKYDYKYAKVGQYPPSLEAGLQWKARTPPGPPGPIQPSVQAGNGNRPLQHAKGQFTYNLRGPGTSGSQKFIGQNQGDPDSWFYIETEEAKVCEVARMRWHGL